MKKCRRGRPTSLREGRWLTIHMSCGLECDTSASNRDIAVARGLIRRGPYLEETRWRARLSEESIEPE